MSNTSVLRRRCENALRSCAAIHRHLNILRLFMVGLAVLPFADATFAQLFGKDASQRYDLIMEEAIEADDIDY